jgi:hypothetical protein
LIESQGVAVHQQNGVVAGSRFAIVHLGHAVNTRRSYRFGISYEVLR